MENEIKVGEYCRTKDGIIDKVIEMSGTNNILLKHRFIDREGFKSKNYIYERDVVAHSKDVIDLIQIDDYVNGHRVIKPKQSITYSSIEVENSIAKKEIIPKNKIKTIVTKEQFDSVSYKWGE